MSTFPLSSTAPRTREVVRHELRRRTIRVLDRVPLPGPLVRFTFGGDLAGFTSFGPEDHVKVFFETADGPVGRDYTPAEFRPVGRSSGPELDLDFVVHGTAGPATAWASAAEAGAELGFGGPRGSRLAPTGFRNALLLADPAGQPALRRWIRAFAGVLPVHALLFGGAEARYLSEAETATALPQVLDAEHDLLEVTRSQDATADTFVWAAGEATALIPVRRFLRHELGLPAQNLSLHGYWKAGTAGLDHHAPLDPADPD